MNYLDKKIHNFNAGPGILPKEVFRKAAEAVENFNNTGLSILEIGHRTPLFTEVMETARGLVRKLMKLPDTHEVLFLHGGASTQFFQVPMNLLDSNEFASIADTGVWSSKAIKETRLFGHVEVVCSGKDVNYSSIPKNFRVASTSKYLHITTNNTIYGTQWRDLTPFYKFGVPLVADMSSDILSREIDFEKFDLIYAGAQKNIGAAGVNLVVVNKEILGKTTRAIPTMLDYREHIKNASMLNTPPVFAVYVSMLTLQWLDQLGGVAEIEKINRKKAEMLYGVIDKCPMYKGTAAKEDRSMMNACFVIEDKELEKEFLSLADNEGMVGIKGHRSVGGFRVSMYNSLEIESVEALCSLMEYFANKKG